MLAREKLVLQLQRAYSGEQAAALAYRGHWASVSNPEERSQIRQIEEEEWHHRRLVGGMLHDLGSGPTPGREVRTWIIGKTLGLLCHVMGWYLPMYAAGRLESMNVEEYVDAAHYARDSGHSELVECLLSMALLEWDHEQFFRSKVEGRWLPLWPAPSRESIRA